MKRLFTFTVLFLFAFVSFAQNTCDFTNFSYEVKPDGAVFYISITAPSASAENYSVYLNQEKQEADGSKYGPFESDCETFYTLFVVQNNSEACYVQAGIGTICAETDECKISEIEYSYPECSTDGLIFVDLDFIYRNVSDSFTVSGNQTSYGTFAYTDLPISVGPITPDCEKQYEFEIVDKEIESCFAAVEEIRICCPQNCTPPAFEIVSMTCSEDELNMKLVLVDEVVNSNLMIKINEEYLESFEIDLPYIYITSPLPLNIVRHTITVCSVGIADLCCYTQDFTTDVCSSNTDCKIYDLNFDIPECEQNQEVFIGLNFEVKNPASDSFHVQANSIDYGEYAYSDLPIEIGPFSADCDLLYEFVISDAVDPDCANIVEDLIVCCNPGCLEPIFEIVSIACSESNIEMKLELIHPLPSDILFININDQFIEDYEVNFPYLYLTAENTGDVVNELSICVDTSLDFECCYAHLFELECNPNDECAIGEIFVEPSDCIDTGLPGFLINFEHVNVGTQGFSLKGNGSDYGDFEYEDLPILIQVGEDCDKFYEFVIIDNEFECSNFIEYGNFCCSNNCSFRLKETSVQCDEAFITEIAFYIEEDTDPIKEYKIYANGIFIGETERNNEFFELPTEIPIAPGEEIELTVCDSECCVSQDLNLSNCIEASQDCEISYIQTSEVSCDNGQIDFELDFEYQGTNSDEFDVYSIFGYVATYKYADLPLKVTDFPSANIGLNVLFVCDKGSLCCQVHLFNSPSCLAIDEGVSYVKEQNSTRNHNYIRQNPAHLELVLDSPFKNTKYRLIDNSGKFVKTFNSIDASTREDISDLASGLYILRIENKGEIKIEKLIITN